MMSTCTNEEEVRALIIEELKKRAVPVHAEISQGREDREGKISYIRI